MSARKPKIAPVPDDVITDIVAKMTEECSATYKVADNAEIDWCPCCGVNIRLRLNGQMFAKFVCSPSISRQIGAKLIAMAHRAEHIQSDPAVLQKSLDDLKAACAKKPPAIDKAQLQWSEENCPGHVAWSVNPKICANCGVHIDSLRPPEDEHGA